MGRGTMGAGAWNMGQTFEAPTVREFMNYYMNFGSLRWASETKKVPEQICTRL